MSLHITLTNNVTERLKFKMKNKKFKTFLEEKRFHLVQNSAKIWAALHKNVAALNIL